MNGPTPFEEKQQSPELMNPLQVKPTAVIMLVIAVDKNSIGRIYYVTRVIFNQQALLLFTKDPSLLAAFSAAGQLESHHVQGYRGLFYLRSSLYLCVYAIFMEGPHGP